MDRTPTSLRRIYAPRRVAYTSAGTLLVMLLMQPSWVGSQLVLLARLLVVAIVALTAFGVLETWPRALPPRVARWAVRVVAVAISIPLGTLLAYLAIGDPSGTLFWTDAERFTGWTHITALGLILAPWMAVAALIRQIGDAAREQALAFELERSELERKAVDSRLRELEARVEPHFLFNTLANVRELVLPASRDAAAVLDSLIVYLRAAVSTLNRPGNTLAREAELVRSYLEVMHLRMPDRLEYSVDVDPRALACECPPMTLLTLVENAVRHGIDPIGRGGRVDVAVRRVGAECVAVVSDTGVGLRRSPNGNGTGLATLRERLALAFGAGAGVTLAPGEPRGARAEVRFPAREVAA
jgi:hypothetical protein